jgi:hypothetical protein
MPKAEPKLELRMKERQDIRPDTDTELELEPRFVSFLDRSTVIQDPVQTREYEWIGFGCYRVIRHSGAQ